MPATARAIAGWFALHGAVGLALAGESPWSGMRIILHTDDRAGADPGGGCARAIHVGLDARRNTASDVAAAS